MATNKAPKISKIVNNDYLKEFLTNRIASKSIEHTQKKAMAARKASRNRQFKFRSGSVMKKVPTAVQHEEQAIL